MSDSTCVPPLLYSPLRITNLRSCGLQSIHIAIRSSLAHIRQSRIAPSAINAPPPGFVPPSLGVGLPTSDSSSVADGGRGLQEERVERDAWNGILDALTRVKEARDREAGEQEEDMMG